MKPVKRDFTDEKINIPYEIGATYVYPNSRKRFVLISVAGQGKFLFKCGHWCTDNVFRDLLKINASNKRIINEQFALKL